jgi:hypothetical protein
MFITFDNLRYLFPFGDIKGAKVGVEKFISE